MTENELRTLRRITRAITDDPDWHTRKGQGRRDGTTILRAAIHIITEADQALARANDYSGRGYAGTSAPPEGRGKGGHTDPTLQAANLDASHPGHPDDYTTAGQELRAALTETAAHARNTLTQARRILATAPPATAVEAARCTEYATGGCEDLAVKAGRCHACYQWHHNNPGHSHVPADLIAARRNHKAIAS